MKRDYILVSILWLALTAIGELLAIFVDIYPAVSSDKGEVIEQAFRVLVYFAVPVLTLVIAVLLYTVATRRTVGLPEEDGPPLHGRGTVPLAWFTITAALTLTVMIYPGLVEISEIFGVEDNPDLIVEVEGVQWTWFISYPEHGVERVSELVLPVDRSVRFEITSLDVLHSFWVPGFLMKIDAVPGRTTEISLTPTRIGSFQADPNFRVQCAEMCGISHARMQIPVRVVTEVEFEEWLAERANAATSPTDGEPVAADAQQFTIVGEKIAFDIDEIVAESDRQIKIVFDNRDAAIPHNWALYESEEAAAGKADLIAGSPVEAGPLVQEIVFDAPAPGTYYYICDVHPNMNGELVVQ